MVGIYIPDEAVKSGADSLKRKFYKFEQILVCNKRSIQ